MKVSQLSVVIPYLLTNIVKCQEEIPDIISL